MQTNHNGDYHRILRFCTRRDCLSCTRAEFSSYEYRNRSIVFLKDLFSSLSFAHFMICFTGVPTRSHQRKVCPPRIQQNQCGIECSQESQSTKKPLSMLPFRCMASPSPELWTMSRAAPRNSASSLHLLLLLVAPVTQGIKWRLCHAHRRLDSMPYTATDHKIRRPALALGGRNRTLLSLYAAALMVDVRS